MKCDINGWDFLEMYYYTAELEGHCGPTHMIDFLVEQGVDKSQALAIAIDEFDPDEDELEELTGGN